jgi:site-specific DNA recombinase
LYRRCDDEQRRLLNQALFERLYIGHDDVVNSTLCEPFALMHGVQIHYLANQAGSAAELTDSTEAASPTGNGLCATYGLEALFPGMYLDQGSTKPYMVGLTPQHTNQTILVEGPEIRIRPVGTRRSPADGDR